MGSKGGRTERSASIIRPSSLPFPFFLSRFSGWTSLLKKWVRLVQIRSLRRQVLKLQPRLASENHGDRQAAQADIARLEQQMSAIRYGVPEAP